MPYISPSDESEQDLDKPIKVVNRSIPINAIVKKHQHSWGQFIYANKGVLSVVTDIDRHIVPPEQGVWITPNISHEVTALTHVELTSFYLGQTMQSKMPKSCSVLAVNPFLKALIVEAKDTKSDYCFADTDGLLLRLLIEKLALAPKVELQLPSPHDKRLLTMLSMIQKDPANRYGLTEWGKILGASSRTLSRLFKAETGMPYNKWRQRLNVQIAIRKISAGESIATTASDLGYESPSAFSYMFREVTGNTPSFYCNKK